MPPTYSESQKPNIGWWGIFTNVLASFLWTNIVSINFLFMVPLEGRFFRGAPSVMAEIYRCFPLLASLLSPMVLVSAVIEGDFPLGDSFMSLFPLCAYLAYRSILINPLMAYFCWMQSSVLWSRPFWKRALWLVDLMCLSNGGKGLYSYHDEPCVDIIE